MNRIQQILEKAERDETVRGLSLREVAVAEAATAPYGAPERYEPDEEAEAVEEPFAAPRGSDARDFAVDGPDRDAPDSRLRFQPQRIASLDRGAAEPAPRCHARSRRRRPPNSTARCAAASAAPRAIRQCR